LQLLCKPWRQQISELPTNQTRTLLIWIRDLATGELGIKLGRYHGIMEDYYNLKSEEVRMDYILSSPSCSII
jgi:hypothetical protein